MGYLLEARKVSVTRRGTRILRDVTFGLHRGELCVVLGPSGSGKSTLVRALAGVLPPDRGDVALDGERLDRIDDEAVARSIGCVPQDDVIHRELRVRRALEHAARLRLPADAPEEEVQAAVSRVLRAVELEDRARVRIRRLSGGQRKRASVGLELLLAPPVLLLDEPTSGLDPALEARTMALLRSLADEGRLVVATTHAMASLALADVVIVIGAGLLAWAGPLDGALQHFRADDPSSIFERLRSTDPATWARRYAGSSHAARFRTRAAPGART